MATSISTVRAREGLKPRHEPYFVKVARGQYLGFRKLTPGGGTWIARQRDEHTGRQVKHSLGDFSQLPPSDRFDAAMRAALEWFAHMGRGGAREAMTVRKACEAYVAHIRASKGDTAARDLDGRFRRWVYGRVDLAGVELQKLTRAKVEHWRKSVAQTPARINRDDRDVPLTRPRAPASVNRDMSALRAALNYAHDLGYVTTDMAWRVALRPIRNADRRRDVYLPKEQRRQLIEHAAGDLARFLRGLSLLPLRPGALAALTVADFDARLSSLRIGKDKAGSDRRIRLPAQTATFFAELAKDKTPAAPLFTRADGRAWDKDSWKKPMKAAALAAKLPPATTAYALRHSTITDLIVGGLDPVTVATLSGTSVLMIQRHYGHLQAEHAAEALARLAI